MDKQNHFKPTTQKMGEYLRLDRSMRHAAYTDPFKYSGYKFSTDLAQLNHMNLLREWSLAYGRGNRNVYHVMHGSHVLKQEAWYQYYATSWKRGIILLPLLFAFSKFGKKAFFKTGNYDSHDTDWRDNTCLL